MDIVFNGLPYRLRRRLKEWSDIDIKSEVSKCGCNDPGTAVMAQQIETDSKAIVVGVEA